MDYEKEYNELKKEFNRIAGMLYIANDKISTLEKVNHKQEKQIDKLIDMIRDYKIRLGEKI